MVHTSFTVKCPHCNSSNKIEDNWDIRESFPLMQGMIDRFTKDTDFNYPTLVDKDWIESTKNDGYENPYACKSCGADFEIKKVDW